MWTRNCAGIFALFIIGSSASARPMQPWSYEMLNKEADLVVLATVVSSAAGEERFDKRLLPGIEMESRLTRFAVKAVLKGKAAGKEIDLVHFVVSDKAEFQNRPNGPNVASFRKIGRHLEISKIDGSPVKQIENEGKPHYLLFLKGRPDEKFEPISGHVDSAFSVMTVQPEMTPVEDR